MISTDQGMLYGRILRSEVAHANVKDLDLTRAEELPGVKAVIPLTAGRQKGPLSRAGDRRGCRRN